MNPLLRNVLAVIGGFVVGSAVNMGLIVAGGSIIAPPVGAHVTTMEGLKASMHLFGPEHFLFPFLAHALGTLAGAAIAAGIAISHKFRAAMAVGVLFLAGGVANVLLLPSPMWFNAVDLLGAYIPMAWIGWKLADRKR
jgi:hypothetical protein